MDDNSTVLLLSVLKSVTVLECGVPSDLKNIFLLATEGLWSFSLITVRENLKPLDQSASSDYPENPHFESTLRSQYPKNNKVISQIGIVVSSVLPHECGIVRRQNSEIFLS